MIIHHVTDLHVPDDGADERFSHVRENVLRLFRFIEAEKPDLLVISGDLTMTDYSEDGCRWVQSRLPNVPVVVIPGNHDDPCIVERVFGPWPWRQDYPDCTLMFLDSSADEVPQDKIEMLAKVDSNASCALFIHHPPHLIGRGFMSKNQPLLNHEEVARSISNSAIRYVFCGHYHNQAHVKCNGFELYLTPSPAFQIALELEQFTMQEFRPAVRTIDIDLEGASSELVYV